MAREFDDELGQNMETASPLDATAPRLRATSVVLTKSKSRKRKRDFIRREITSPAFRQRPPLLATSPLHTKMNPSRHDGRALGGIPPILIENPLTAPHVPPGVPPERVYRALVLARMHLCGRVGELDDARVLSMATAGATHTRTLGSKGVGMMYSGPNWNSRSP